MPFVMLARLLCSSTLTNSRLTWAVAVERAINSRTRGIVAVHTFGVPADMPMLVALARRHKLALIEDACEALGATIHSQPIGSFGDVAVFAFYPTNR